MLDCALVAAHGLSLVASNRGCSSLLCADFYCGGFSCGAQAQRLMDFSSCRTSGLVASWHVESSQTRDGTRVPCIGRQILKHWTTREVLGL